MTLLPYPKSGRARPGLLMPFHLCPVWCTLVPVFVCPTNSLKVACWSLWHAADIEPVVEVDGGAGGLGPPHHHQLSATSAGGRPVAGAQPAADDAGGDEGARLLDPHRQPEAPAGGEPGDRPLVRDQGAGP